MKQILIALTLFFSLLLVNGMRVHAWDDGHGNYFVCHCEDNQCETLTLPLDQATNHLKQHVADYEDRCVDTPTTSPSAIPATPTDQPVSTPSATLTPSEAFTPTMTPTGTATPTLGPSATPAPGPSATPMPQPTQVPVVVPQAAPNTGYGGM